MPSVENHTLPAKTGRPRGLTSRAARKRREESYRFHLLGLTQEQIGEALHISQGQVSRYIDDVRKAKVWMNKPAAERYKLLMQEIYDRTELWYGEASRLYYAADISFEEKNAKTNLLRAVDSILGGMRKFLPDAQILWANAIIEEIRSRQNEIEKDYAEKRLAERVLPSGRRASLESARLNE